MGAERGGWGKGVDGVHFSIAPPAASQGGGSAYPHIKHMDEGPLTVRWVVHRFPISALQHRHEKPDGL